MQTGLTVAKGLILPVIHLEFDLCYTTLLLSWDFPVQHFRFMLQFGQRLYNRCIYIQHFYGSTASTMSSTLKFGSLELRH